MTDSSSSSPAPSSTAPAGTPAAETAALQEVLAAVHAAVWGHGVVGAALPEASRAAVAADEQAARDRRDQLVALLASRGVDPVPAEAGYAVPFPVLSAVDAAALAVTLQDGLASAWAWLLDRSAERSTRVLAVEGLADAEVHAVAWRAAAGRTPATTALPGLPAG